MAPNRLKIGHAYGLHAIGECVTPDGTETEPGITPGPPSRRPGAEKVNMDDMKKLEPILCSRKFQVGSHDRLGDHCGAGQAPPSIQKSQSRSESRLTSPGSFGSHHPPAAPRSRHRPPPPWGIPWDLHDFPMFCRRSQWRIPKPEACVPLAQICIGGDVVTDGQSGRPAGHRPLGSRTAPTKGPSFPTAVAADVRRLRCDARLRGRVRRRPPCPRLAAWGAAGSRRLAAGAEDVRTATISERLGVRLPSREALDARGAALPAEAVGGAGVAVRGAHRVLARHRVLLV
eukprot:gene17534-biopygen9398